MQLKTNCSADSRRYELDWIRVLAFSLLILYHVGMMYVDWGWHIASQHLSEYLEYLMLLVNQWRIPLLFFVSGCAFYFASRKYRLSRLFKLRTLRLLLPILLGILVLAPIQLFYEMQFYDSLDVAQFNYWQFHLEYLNPQSRLFEGWETPLLHHMRWYHIWFIVYLLFYSLILFVLKLLPLTRVRQKVSLYLFDPKKKLRIWLAPALVMFGISVTMRDAFPRTWAFYDDWFAHAILFSFLLLGYLMASNTAVWRQVQSYRKMYLSSGIVCFLVTRWVFSLPEDTPLPDWFETLIDTIIVFLVQLNIWSWILAVCGFSRKYLNKNSPALRYLNQAVYPLYLVHQVITVTFGFYAINWGLGAIIEPMLVIIVTVVGSLLCFEIIRRFKVLRVLFGLSPDSTMPLAESKKPS